MTRFLARFKLAWQVGLLGLVGIVGMLTVFGLASRAEHRQNQINAAGGDTWMVNEDNIDLFERWLEESHE